MQRDHTTVAWLVAYAFYNRIEMFGRRHRHGCGEDPRACHRARDGSSASSARLTHLARRDAGKMDRAQWEGTANGLAFTRDQAELIRSTVRATMMN